MPKILIIRFSSIGDIVLTTPVIRCLKKQVPDVELHFLTKGAFQPVLKANPYIDKIHVLAHSWDLMIHELKEEGYDAIVDLHHNLRTMRVKKELGIPAYSFPKLNVRKFVYVNLKWNLLPDIHIVDRYLKTTETWGVKNDGMGLDYFIPADEIIVDRDIPVSHHAGYFAFVIGANHATKRLPVEKWKELCAQLNHPIILLGGKEDAAAGKQIAEIDSVKVYNACGKFSINESADIVRRAKLVVTHDTGLMHIAAAFKKPILSLWGNTVPAFGMYPYYGNSAIANAIIETKGLWCRPCSKIGYDKCPRGHFKCMNNISIPDLAQRIRGFMR